MYFKIKIQTGSVFAMQSGSTDPGNPLLQVSFYIQSPGGGNIFQRAFHLQQRIPHLMDTSSYYRGDLKVWGRKVI